MNLRQTIDWAAIPLAGLAGGTAFLLCVLTLAPLLLDINATVILYYFASLVMGVEVLMSQGSLALLAGVIVHYILSIAFAFVIALVVHHWGLGVGLIGGAILGLSLYSLNFYTMTLLFPWFFAITSTTLVISHIVYGAVTGAVYEIFDHYDEGIPTQTEVTL